MSYSIKLASPSAEEFSELRAKVGWGSIDLYMAQLSLDNSLFHVVARDGNHLIGMARVVGDGVMYFYIQDLVIDPQFQRKGIGRALMNEVEKYLSETAKQGATIALLSAQGKEGFYAPFGYVERSGVPLGKAMCKFI